MDGIPEIPSFGAPPYFDARWPLGSKSPQVPSASAGATQAQRPPEAACGKICDPSPELFPCVECKSTLAMGLMCLNKRCSRSIYNRDENPLSKYGKEKKLIIYDQKVAAPDKKEAPLKGQTTETSKNGAALVNGTPSEATSEGAIDNKNSQKLTSCKSNGQISAFEVLKRVQYSQAKQETNTFDQPEAYDDAPEIVLDVSPPKVWWYDF